MSRGFVKEGDQEDVPIVAPRAYLPDGVTNYVTPAGLDALHAERDEWLEQRKSLIEQVDKDHRVQINYINANLNLLEERIHSAQVVDVSHQAKDTILFGAKATLYKKEEECTCQYQIVGVDEANISENKISFLSPLAKVLLNKKIGDIVTLKTPKGIRTMKVQSIEY